MNKSMIRVGIILMRLKHTNQPFHVPEFYRIVRKYKRVSRDKKLIIDYQYEFTYNDNPWCLSALSYSESSLRKLSVKRVPLDCKHIIGGFDMF